MIILGLGSNVGDRLHHLRSTLEYIKRIPKLSVEHVSPVYISDALLPENSPASWDTTYLNLALRCETRLSPLELLGHTKRIEQEISFGSWITFAKQIGFNEVKEFLHLAHDLGINFFDNAEGYAHGEAEILMGKAIKDFRREDLVISTKIFWGGNGPNDTGLSRKHLFEGTKNSLKRLQLDYVDLLFCHRPDPETCLEEIIFAMDFLVRSGYALYWGTSEWPAELVEEAYKLAEKMNYVKPSMEQPRYNMFYRERLEKEYSPLFEKYGMGATIWSPLASGILSGKYEHGIPQDSRLAKEAWLIPSNFQEQVEKTKSLSKIAKELDCSTAQLAIAWCLKNPRVTTVITGATKKEQLLDDLTAIEIKPKLTEEIMKKIDAILK